MNWFNLVSLLCTAASVLGSRLPSATHSNTELQSLENTDCFCSASGPKITDNLDPENEGLVRLVIFAYQKVNTGEITIFIPQRKYQKCIQDFPLSTGKAYNHYEKYPIHDIFENLANKNVVIENPVHYESDEVINFNDSDVQDEGKDLSLESNSANYEAEREGAVKEKIPHWQIPITDYITGKITGDSHEGPFYLTTGSLEEQKIIPQKWISDASEDKASPSVINEYLQKNPKETFNYHLQYDADVEDDATPSQLDLYLNEGNQIHANKPNVIFDQEDNISLQNNSERDSSDENAKFVYDPPGSADISDHKNDDVIPENDSESERLEDYNSSQFDVYLNEGNYFPATKPYSSGKITYFNDALTPQINSGGEHPLDELRPSKAHQNFGLSISLNKPAAEKVGPSTLNTLLHKGNQFLQKQMPISGGLLNLPQLGSEKSPHFNNFLQKEVVISSESEGEEESHISGTSNVNDVKIQYDQYVPYSSESNDESARPQNQHTLTNHLTFPTSNEYEYNSDSTESSDSSNNDSEKSYNSNQPPLLPVEKMEENSYNDNQSLIDNDTQELVHEDSLGESNENKKLHFPEASVSKIQPPFLKVLQNLHENSVNRMLPLKNNHLQINYIGPKTLKGNYGGKDRGMPYRGHHTTPKEIKFNHWFQKQLKGIKDNGTEMPTKPAVIRSVKRAISKTLRKNGLWVSRDGRLHSTNGKVYSLSNLKLQPLLIGRSVSYDHLIKIKGKYRVPPKTPFIEGLLMSMLKPTKILGIVPLGITSLSRRFNPNGEYMLQIERRKLDAGAQKALSQILPSRRSGSTLAVTSPNTNLNHLWRSVSDILKKGGTTVTKIKGVDEGKEDSGARRHDHGFEGHVHSDGDTSESDDDEVPPSFRIIGGISATGTGTPIASKGRSGVDEYDTSDY